MTICILCLDEHKRAAREKAKQIPEFARHTTLAIPLSGDGELPVTHWFCTFGASDSMHQKIKDLQEFTEVVESEPRPFLESRGLKVIPANKIHKKPHEDN